MRNYRSCADGVANGGERHFNEGVAQGYLAQRLQGFGAAFDAFGSGGGLSVDKLRGHARFSYASRGKVLPRI
jgi:hypothetical protein